MQIKPRKETQCERIQSKLWKVKEIENISPKTNQICPQINKKKSDCKDERQINCYLKQIRETTPT